MVAAALSATFNAFAFAGAGFLFSKLSKTGYEKEMKRHNLVMETLQKDRDEWNEARLKELDRVAKLHYDKQESLKDINETNRDFQLVKTKFEKIEPKLSKYFTPSNTMQEYMTFVKFAATIPVLYGVVALI